MNCQQALSLLYDIIDKEASEIDARDVQEHLDSCRICFEIYRLEGAVQDLIIERLRTDVGQPSPRIETLRTKILSDLDTIDGKERRVNRRPPFSLAARTLVAAATLAILITAAFYGSRFYQDYQKYSPFQKAHLATQSAGHLYHDDNHTSTAMAYIRNEMTYEIGKNVGSFCLLCGNIEEIKGMETGHFVYVDGNSVVSVFVVPSNQFEIPSDLSETMVIRDRIAFFDHNCRGCRLVFHKVGAAIIITATTERAVDLLEFVPGHATI